jgi:hypothetical protein
MNEDSGIINLNQFRNRKQEEKKRKTERIFFHNLVGVYGVVNSGKMVPVELIDVSDAGLGIQIPYQSERTWPTESSDVTLRLYFSEDSFMEIGVSVMNSRPTIENGNRYHRYGCAVDPNHRSYPAWTQFVGFLRAYSDVSERDTGNIGIGNL